MPKRGKQKKKKEKRVKKKEKGVARGTLLSFFFPFRESSLRRSSLGAKILELCREGEFDGEPGGGREGKREERGERREER